MADPKPDAPKLGFPPQDPALKPWPEARKALETAKTYWLSTVRPDGRPHVVPVWGLWLDDALLFSTSAASQARNLEFNSRCALSVPGEGLDIVIEGDVSLLDDEAALQRAGVLYSQKYGWPYAGRDGGFYDSEGHGGPVYVVKPSVVFGFGDASAFSATRWVFGD